MLLEPDEFASAAVSPAPAGRVPGVIALVVKDDPIGA